MCDSLLRTYPRNRPPLSPAHQASYVEHYRANRAGHGISRVVMHLEAWMHRQLARQPGGAQVELLRKRFTEEYEAFREAVVRWADLREKLLEARRAMIERWERALMQSRLKQLEYGLRLQSHRVRVLSAQLG